MKTVLLTRWMKSATLQLLESQIKFQVIYTLSKTYGGEILHVMDLPSAVGSGKKRPSLKKDTKISRECTKPWTK